MPRPADRGMDFLPELSALGRQEVEPDPRDFVLALPAGLGPQSGLDYWSQRKNSLSEAELWWLDPVSLVLHPPWRRVPFPYTANPLICHSAFSVFWAARSFRRVAVRSGSVAEPESGAESEFAGSGPWAPEPVE